MKQLEDFFVKNKDRHLKMIGKIIYNDFDTVEDIVQEAYMKAILYWDSFDEKKAGLNTWFNSILFNTMRDFQKKFKNNPESTEDADLWMSIPSFADRGVDLEVEINMYQCNAQSKIVLKLYYLLGYRSKEISSIEDISVTNVTTICSRFKKHVERRYDVELR